MKRLVAIVLICLLTANVGGFSVTHHICGKKSQYYSLTGKKKNSHCCCKGGTKDKGCCKTKVIKVKVDDNRSVAKHLLPNHQLIADLVPQPIFLPEQRKASFLAAPIVPLIHPPPFISGLRLNVLYQVFLI